MRTLSLALIVTGNVIRVLVNAAVARCVGRQCPDIVCHGMPEVSDPQVRAASVVAAVEAQPEPWCDRRSPRRDGRQRAVHAGTATSVASWRSPESCADPAGSWLDDLSCPATAATEVCSRCSRNAGLGSVRDHGGLRWARHRHPPRRSCDGTRWDVGAPRPHCQSRGVYWR